MTNLEWLRTLSAGDLAKLFWNSCEVCAYHNNCELESGDDSECVKGISMWLEQKYIEEIKPCANCGGEAKFNKDAIGNAMGINPELGYVQCCECHMRTPVGTKHDVIKTWNRRVDDGRQ